MMPADLVPAPDPFLSAATEIDQAAAAVESGPAAPGAAPAVPVVVDWPAESHDFVDFAAGLFIPLYPRLAAVWTAEQRATLERRLAPVLQKYNLSAERLLGKWGPEIMLAAAIAPAVLPTIKAVREDMREMKENARALAHPIQPAPAAPAAPASSAGPVDKLQLHRQAGTADSAAPVAPDKAQLHTQA